MARPSRQAGLTPACRMADDAASALVVTDTPGGLGAIHRPETAAAIWRRRPVAGFRPWIDGLDPACLPAARVILRPAQARAAVAAICDAAGMPAARERDRLIDDIAALADLFARLNGTRTFLRLTSSICVTTTCTSTCPEVPRRHPYGMARLHLFAGGRGTHYWASSVSTGRGASGCRIHGHVPARRSDSSCRRQALAALRTADPGFRQFRSPPMRGHGRDPARAGLLDHARGALGERGARPAASASGDVSVSVSETGCLFFPKFRASAA